MTATARAFALPDHLAHKADPALVAVDEEHLTRVADALDHAATEVSTRLDEARRAPGGPGRAALDRDLDVHRLTGRLRALRRFGLDVCLGRVVHEDDAEPVWIGRLGLTDEDGRRLLVDWRSPAAEPFFGATHANPMGLASRRRYRWTGGRVTDYWDEVFTPEGLEHHAALDDQSAFVASLGASRSPRMRDVLGTIQADQDAIIRAGSRRPLVVDGGPGTGKTVVALHRTAYLLYSDPRLGHRGGGVLFVGPHEPYLAYVSDVLPGLGEDGVRTCTLRDLLPEGAAARPEDDPAVAALKDCARMASAVEPAVALYEEPPTDALEVTTPWGEVVVDAGVWASTFDAPEPGTPHNEARDQLWTALAALAHERLDGEDVDPAALEDWLRRERPLRAALERGWPLLDAEDLVGDLWTVPAYLRRCAPWLSLDEVRSLQRPEPRAWSLSDLPLLDAMRHRLGDPDADRLAVRRRTAAAAEEARVQQVVDDLMAADHDREGLAMMLRHPDLRSNLVDESALPTTDRDVLAGPFAHVVVDEAQELTDAEWQVLLRRCPSHSLTVVGDRAQARHGFTESWEERLARVGLDRVVLAPLTVNYRTPDEVMAEAEPVIRAAIPDANVPMSIRHSGVPVLHEDVARLEELVDDWVATHPEGVACVVGDPTFPATDRVRSLDPVLVKGLEFDLVVLVDPDSWGDGIEGAVDRYVAMTRATQRLVVLTSSDTGHHERPRA